MLRDRRGSDRGHLDRKAAIGTVVSTRLSTRRVDAVLRLVNLICFPLRSYDFRGRRMLRFNRHDPADGVWIPIDPEPMTSCL
jgi:hypothetical protein